MRDVSHTHNGVSGGQRRLLDPFGDLARISRPTLPSNPESTWLLREQRHRRGLLQRYAVSVHALAAARRAAVLTMRCRVISCLNEQWRCSPRYYYSRESKGDIACSAWYEKFR